MQAPVPAEAPSNLRCHDCVLSDECGLREEADFGVIGFLVEVLELGPGLFPSRAVGRV